MLQSGRRRLLARPRHSERSRVSVFRTNGRACRSTSSEILCWRLSERYVFYTSQLARNVTDETRSIKSLSSLETQDPGRPHRSSSISQNRVSLRTERLVVHNLVVSPPCPSQSELQKKWVVGWARRSGIRFVSRIARVPRPRSSS